MKQVNYNIIRDNISNIKEFCNKEVMFVVKNDGYNTDIIKLVEHVDNVDYVMVSSVSDALKVSSHKNIHVYINSVLSREELKLIRFYDIEIMVDSLEYVKENNDVLKTINVHLKVNTSMNRFGIDTLAEGNDIIEFCLKNQINIVGLLTHFSLEDESSEMYDKHVAKFNYFYNELSKLNKFKIVHAENSYTMQKLDDNLSFCNYVRCGIICYGYGLVDTKLSVTPCMSFSGRVVKIRKLCSEDNFSYGLNNKLQEDGLVAIVDVGYGDGLLKNRIDLEVTIGGLKYPLVGNISMSNCYVLVDDKVSVFDEVIFYNGLITVENHAKKYSVATSNVMCYLK